MPEGAKRLCVGGCGAIVAGGRCAGCTTKLNQQTGSSTKRGYDWDWRRLRARFLIERCQDCGRNPISTCLRCGGTGLANAFCAECLDSGRRVPATQVDHILKFQDAPSLRLMRGNLQGLCTLHHGQKTRAENFNEEFSAFQVTQREKVTHLLAA